MKILIINIDGYPEQIGGTKRVSSILGNEWIQKDGEVAFLSYCTSSLHFPDIAGIKQFFFQNSTAIDCKENREYFEALVVKKAISIVLNQFSNIPEMVALCAYVRKQTEIKLISAYHFAIMHQFAIVRNSFFPKVGLDNCAFAFLKGCMRWLQYMLYKRHKMWKNLRSELRTVYNTSDRLVLLSKKFFPDFKNVTGLSDISCLFAIPNPEWPENSNNQIGTVMYWKRNKI